MELFHTSPDAITKIDGSGRFGSFLFFSDDIYTMTAGDYVTYKIEIDDDSIIDAGHFFYHENSAKLNALVAEFCARFDVDEDTAQEIISERQQLENFDADDSWDAQLYTARAARILGYRGVKVADEQGASYMIDMLDKENELVRV